MGLTGYLKPDLYLESVLELGVDRLRELGLDALLLDVDCTLKRYGEGQPSGEVCRWLADVRAAGVAVCLISNGRDGRISRLAAALGLPFVSKACKPLARGCRAALRKLGAEPRRTAMVGDQVFADVMAGRRAGLTTILVRPIHPEEEPWFTRLKRPLEKWLLKRFYGPAK